MENFRPRGTKVPRTFRSQKLSFPYLCALVYSISLGVVIVYDADLNCYKMLALCFSM